nr:immunoglobulin heavy chain junction region [Macaca mulatta]
CARRGYGCSYYFDRW